MKTDTKQGLIDMLELNQSVHKGQRLLKVIGEIKNLDLPDLEDGYSYTARFKNVSEEEVIKYEEFWNDKLDCFDSRNKEVIAVVKI